MGFRTSPEKQVKYSSLDIADKSSIESLVDTINKEHKAVDVLINNAGVYFEDKYNPQNVKTTFDVNVRGTLQVRAQSICSLHSISLMSKLKRSLHAFFLSTPSDTRSKFYRAIHTSITDRHENYFASSNRSCSSFFISWLLFPSSFHISSSYATNTPPDVSLVPPPPKPFFPHRQHFLRRLLPFQIQSRHPIPLPRPQNHILRRRICDAGIPGKNLS